MAKVTDDRDTMWVGGWHLVDEHPVQYELRDVPLGVESLQPVLPSHGSNPLLQGPNRRRCPERDGTHIDGKRGWRRWWQSEQLAGDVMPYHVPVHAGRHPTVFPVQAHLAINDEP